MLNRLFHILLITMIITCPVRCLTGSCCSDSQLGEVSSDAKSCCCSTMDTESESSDDGLPTPPCSKCHCLCSGATMPDSFQFTDVFVWEYHCEQVATVSESPEPSNLVRCRGPDGPESCSPANVGREIRTLHASLII